MRDLQKDWNVLYGIIDWIAIPKQQIVKEWLERAIKAEAENAKLRAVVEAAREYKTAFDTAVANPNKHGMALYSLMDNVARAETLLFEALDE